MNRLALGHTAGKEQSWASDPFLSNSKAGKISRRSNLPPRAWGCHTFLPRIPVSEIGSLPARTSLQKHPPKRGSKGTGEESCLYRGKLRLCSASGCRCPGLLRVGSWRATSSLTSGDILGVLTGGYKLKNGPLRCGLFIIKTMLLNARKVIHSGRSTSPDFSGRARPRPCSIGGAVSLMVASARGE